MSAEIELKEFVRMVVRYQEERLKRKLTKTEMIDLMNIVKDLIYEGTKKERGRRKISS